MVRRERRLEFRGRLQIGIPPARSPDRGAQSASLSHESLMTAEGAVARCPLKGLANAGEELGGLDGGPGRRSDEGGLRQLLSQINEGRSELIYFLRTARLLALRCPRRRRGNSSQWPGWVGMGGIASRRQPARRMRGTRPEERGGEGRESRLCLGDLALEEVHGEEALGRLDLADEADRGARLHVDIWGGAGLFVKGRKSGARSAIASRGGSVLGVVLLGAWR